MLQVLAGSDHPTAEEIYRALRTKRVAIATVYRTLRLFAKLGVVRQLRARDGCVRYELVGPSHAHFVCLNCGRVFDADQEGVRGGGFRGRGFVVTDSEICLFGYCPACTRKEGVAAHG
ncbi:MAG: transcriptional repressor [Firmicutes bacterium]|nr:transcriptional repressor [Bacillota bacterium]